MWTCEKCNRVFQTTNQSHICVVKDVGELFVGKPDSLVLAWDALTQRVMEWQPNVYSASTKSIVYTSKKAWLIIKPMKAQLDVKFYHEEKLVSDRIKRHQNYRNKWAHHLRIHDELQVDREVLSLLRQAYDYSVGE
ncbi:MAG TPA: hypothetical protein DCE41_25200 [Cytophagales bacterium]|nr:hypothetical protein [Cytophagales bacterium]HAA17662.1 hypothetical protein [Cytophagales bacterium]HAP62798.1 hypothetical protein [Cytophagales bacterium]